jgi:hypothetical protein
MIDASLLSLGVLLGTAHIGGHVPNDNTPGIYARADVGGVRMTGAVFRNSWHGTSFLLAREIPVGRVSLLVGGVTGYELAPVLPFVGVTGLAGPVRLTVSAGARSVAFSVGLEMSK